jgi:endonuclease/exonuclease/phosphatase family metal-dependent hydrolase
VLALQEADKETERSGKHHIARELAEELKMSWVHVPAGIPRGVPPKKRQWWLNFDEQIGLFDPGDTGIALLSDFPLHEVLRIDLPWHECPWRPRLSVGATIQIGSREIRLFNSHIDPHSAAAGQIEQLEVVLEHARESDKPTVILGDFNTLSSRKCIETRRLLESAGYVTPMSTGIATWRGAGIRLHADWLFVKDLNITRWGVARPLNVSDHWPIWAELQFIG